MATISPALESRPRARTRFVRTAESLLAAALYAFLWCVMRVLYRLRVVGATNVPRNSGALLIANHLSFIDALLLGVAAGRPVRYLIFEDWYRRPLVWPVARIFRAIPIRSDLPPREMLRALHDAGAAIQQGELVCLFAEGEITRLGTLLPFRRGFERIMRGRGEPIIPVYIDVWGSVFSYERSKFFWKLPKKVPYPVSVSFGAPMPAASSAGEIRERITELQADAFVFHKERMVPLHRSFFEVARSRPWRFCMADARTAKPLSYASAMTKTLYLARRLRGVWQGQDTVGLLLPPSVAGALVNYAAQLSGKAVVNLNYTASVESIRAAAEQAGLRTIVTSKAFLAKVPFEAPSGVAMWELEEVAKDPRVGEKVLALIWSWLVPVRVIERLLGMRKAPQVDDTAAIIFSSGSTGEPKGVVLSHFNIAANIEQMVQLFHFVPRDVVIGVLPFFHSFGFTVTLWLPPSVGVGAIYHANPLEAQAIGELSRKYRGTVLVATPTFLQSYLRRCEPEDFAHVWLPIVGAEKLTDRLASEWLHKYGKRPLEGYGATECSPVVAVNSPDFQEGKIFQQGTKANSIGRPLPGVAVRIVDVNTGEPVKTGERGMMLVRGANVMQGYLKNPELTAQVLRDGWYTTGDVAWMDEDGFLHIADRLSRFSKIGGEMVPHLKIEEVLHEAISSPERRFVITSVPDDRRGERLIALHTASELEVEAALLALGQLPPLWRPKRDDFVTVPQLPLLGSGKLDLCEAKRVAKAYVSAQPA